MKKLAFLILLSFVLSPHIAIAEKYKRSDWPHWADLDGDCQNTRVETLLRDSVGLIAFRSGKLCKVVLGHWVGPYTGETIYATMKVDIDHIVPLKHAHLNGGENWSRSKKKKFANDPENLLATTASANRSKGFKGPDEWMPPLEFYHCEYIERWTAIKEKYGLTSSEAEKKKVEDVQAGCQ
jgi:uncharacterized protein DUF1524